MSYSLTLIGVKEARDMLSDRFFEISNRYRIPLAAKEDMEDWIIRAAFNSVLNRMFQVNVRELYKHDLYQAVYSDVFTGRNDSIGYAVELSIRSKILDAKLQFLMPESVKVSVFDDIVILGRQQCNV